MVGGKRVCPSTCRGRGPLVLAVLWGFGLCSRHGALAAVTQAQLAFPDCTAREATGSPAVHVTGNCTWSSQHHGTRVVIQGVRPSLGLYSDESATPVIFAAAAAGPAAPSTGTQLQLERIVLVGFQVSVPDAASPQPVLWPAGLTAGSGEYLNMTDVRVIVSSQDLFNKYLNFFSSQNTLIWTDNTNFLHIKQWSNARTQLRSVGILVGNPAPGSPAAVPVVKNCLMLTTNATLLSALIPHAAVATPLPLLVYLTSNVSIGAHPPLPANGVVVKRPVVFVGLQSVITSIDFQMVVNQLNASASQYSNTTFVGLALENLGPGDTITSAVAAPFSIAVVNNVWAVYYNRSGPQQVRWTMTNVTMVLPQDSEMSYVTYMFTLYNSPLQYLKAQTQFYSDVLHMSMLQFQPGPGNQSITVTHIYSWFHRWYDVVLTTQPQVAKELPLPVRPLPVLTSSTRASPLVQAVRTGEELKAFAQQLVLGDREHILLFLANVSLPTATSTPAATSAFGGNSSSGSAMQLASAMSWIGYNHGEQSHRFSMLVDAAAASPSDSRSTGNRVALDCGYAAAAVNVPSTLPKDALQLQQLVLTHLPQAPGASVPAQFKSVPASLFTLMLWTFARAHDMRSLHLIGITLLLPQPELDYFRAFAQNSNYFVVEMSGTTPTANVPGHRADAITFENAYLEGDWLRVDSVTGPGYLATNVTLRGDPDAVTGMPGGYAWPDPSQLHVPAGRRGHPAWVSAVIAVCVVLAVVLLALAGYMWWQRKRVLMRDPESGQLYAEGGFSKAPSQFSLQRHSSQTIGRRPCRMHSECGNSVCTSTSLCTTCAAVHTAQADSGSTDVHMPLAGSDSAAASARHSPVAGHKDVLCGAAAAGVAALAARAAAGAQNDWQGAGSPPGTARQGRGRDVASQRDASPSSTTVGDGESSSLQDNVAAGMQRWRAAVSSTTMLLMERRMDAAAALNPAADSGTSMAPLGVPDASTAQQNGQQADAQQQPDSAGSGGNVVAGQQLQLLELLGQGSFGSVFLAVWRGKRVAVKMMQLPASALLDPGDQLSTDHQLSPGQQQQRPHTEAESVAERRRRLQRQKQQNSPPHMAIMEAVVSSAMTHPNVVQVYTYVLNPLTSSSTPATDSSGGRHKADGFHVQGGDSSGQDIAGWSVKLVMEYCNEGSLRDALDCGLLAKPGGFLAPSAVLALAHDVAAAMLHLHSEGIVHGDLKAGNVMLTSSGSSSVGSLPGVRMCASGTGDRTLTAKVADFGLALPLGPRDTHATLLARGTPTHMCPELFMAGHVSKASDVYAYGILLYELMTSKRAYAGIPIPLLPHQVALQGLRPEWPEGLPPGCRDLKKLAAACWSHKPHDRPTFVEILQTLDTWSAGGCGWPAVPPGSRAVPPRRMQHSRMQQQQQQQQDADVAALPSASEQPPPPQQQQQQQDDAGDSSQPAPQQQQPLQVEVQVQHAASVRIGGEPGGRNMHMSWSEVDVNQGCEG